MTKTLKLINHLIDLHETTKGELDYTVRTLKLIKTHYKDEQKSNNTKA